MSICFVGQLEADKLQATDSLPPALSPTSLPLTGTVVASSASSTPGSSTSTSENTYAPLEHLRIRALVPSPPPVGLGLRPCSSLQSKHAAVHHVGPLAFQRLPYARSSALPTRPALLPLLSPFSLWHARRHRRCMSRVVRPCISSRRVVSARARAPMGCRHARRCRCRASCGRHRVRHRLGLGAHPAGVGALVAQRDVRYNGPLAARGGTRQGGCVWGCTGH